MAYPPLHSLRLVATTIKTASKWAQGIALVIIISVLVGTIGAFWLSSSVLVPLWATIGGMIVLLGLLVEEEWKEKDEKLKPPFFSPYKSLGECGWRILMFGIAVEIVTAFALTIIEQINEAKNNPLNQPITTATATVWFSTEGPSLAAVGKLNNLWNPRSIHLAFGPSEEVTNPGWPTLDCVNWLNSPEGTNWHWGFQFDQNLLVDPIRNKIVRDADNWNACLVEARFFPPKTKIIGGEVTLFINSEIKKFDIPPQVLKGYNLDFTNFLNNPPKTVTVLGQ